MVAQLHRVVEIPVYDVANLTRKGEQIRRGRGPFHVVTAPLKVVLVDADSMGYRRLNLRFAIEQERWDDW